MQARVSPTHSVRSLEVVLTTACNLSCAYCYQDVRADRSVGWPVLTARERFRVATEDLGTA